MFGRGEAGETRAPGGAGPVFAARLDGDGALAWARFSGGGVPGQGYGVAHDAAGAVAVTGYVNGVATFGNDVNGAPVSIDPAMGRAFVARWDVAGRLLWALPIGGLAGEGDAIAVAASGAIVTTGLFQGQARFGAGEAAPTLLADSSGREGCYLAAFTPGGATMWARRFVGIGVHPWRLRAAPDGDLLMASSFGGGVVLDPDGAAPLTIFASGSTDALFARIAADGALRWATRGRRPRRRARRGCHGHARRHDLGGGHVPRAGHVWRRRGVRRRGRCDAGKWHARRQLLAARAPAVTDR